MVAYSATHQHKRHGKHQKHSKPFLKVYWPYMPLAVILSIGIIFSSLWQAKTNNVLAYATNITTSGLLSSTNSKRSANGKQSLALSSKLNSAAQAKANDMVSKDYWSHNTPSGDPPWVFIDATGYEYSAAGENLAYGFMTSSDVINGWMNSAGHKANMLNSTFTEVGFGIKNSSNFNGDGKQTVVVAMYARPLVLSSTTTAPSSSGSGSTSSAPTVSSSKPKTTVAQKPVPPKEPDPQKSPSPIAFISSTADDTIINGPTISVSRFATLSEGKYTWVVPAASIILVLSLLLFAVRHTYSLHRLFVRGERYVLHHAVFDITIISLAGLCYIISQSVGFIL